MLIFVYGSDTFRSRAKVRELIAAFQKKYDPSRLNSARLDAAKIKLDDFRAAVHAPGFLATRRLVIIEDLLTSKRPKEEQDGLLTMLKTHTPENVIVLWDDLPSEKAAIHPLRKAFAGRAAAEVVTYPFDPLNQRELREWLRAETQRRGITIESPALEALLRGGSNLWQLSADLDKLGAYAAGRPVLLRDLEIFVRRSTEENVFACMDALAERDLPRAGAALRAERAAGTEDMHLFSLLVRQFRLLLLILSYEQESGGGALRSGALARELGLHPFVAGKLSAQSRGFTLAEVRRYFDLLFRYDQEIKTGRQSAGSALDLFLGSLAPSPAATT